MTPKLVKALDPLDPVAPPAWTALLDAMPQGVVLVDAGGRFLGVNPAAARMLGMDRDTLLSCVLPEPWSKGAPADGSAKAREEGPGLRTLSTGAPEAPTALPWRRGDGSVLWLEVWTEPLPGGGALLGFHDLTGQRAQARKLARVTELYAVLSQVNQAIVWSATREALLDKVCEVLVTFGHFAMAWIGQDDPESHEVRVVSQAGDQHGYLEGLRVRSDASVLGRGGTGRAIREGQAVVVDDFLGSLATSPWHEAARRSGFATSASIPIRLRGQVWGALMVYATERNYFGGEELDLLNEAAGDLSHALAHLELEQERQRAEEALLASEERYRTFFENGPDGIVVLDPATRRFLEFNDQACRQLGYTREEFRHLSLGDIEAMETPEDTARTINAVLATGFGRFETRQRTKLGEIRKVLVTAQHLQVRAVTAYHCVWRDLSAHERAEAENRQLQAQLQQAQKMESLGRLAGGVAHDMNNVLGAILSLASAHLVIQPEDSPAYPAFETIRDAATRGGEMVKRLLTFARQHPIEQRDLDLNALLLEEVRLLERTTLARVHLELDLAPDLDPIHGDGSAVAHVFMNLCVNAVDAMGDGGTLTFRTRNLAGHQVEVVVQDTGCGMTREVLARAMDPYFTTKEVGKGTGLGLALVHTTMTAHQGHVSLESEPGLGTKVRLIFPATAAQGAGQEPPAPVQPWPSPAALNVLLIDDDELIQKSTRMLLEVLGHAVTVAAGGEEALGQVEQGLRPELVVLDMNMPGLGGKGTLPRLRELLPGVPVLLATGRADQEALDLVAAHPCVTLMTKPFSFEDLRDHVQRLFHHL